MAAERPIVAARPARGPWQTTPGLRTFASPRFRTTVAAVLVVCATVILSAVLLRQAADPAGQFGIDLAVYRQAALDMAAGRSPYPAAFLERPVGAVEFGHKYSPLMAQVLIPLTWLPVAIATVAWAVLQIILAVVAVWLAGTFAGAARTLERLLWSAAAAALFLPVFDTAWKGNVSAVQAFLVALLLAPPRPSGAALAAGILLKTTPLALLPAVVAGGGTRARWALLALVTATLASVVLAIDAWLDFLRIQPNLLLGPSVDRTNLAPASMAAIAAPGIPWLAGGLRVAAVVLGAIAVVWAIVLARRGRWPAAVVLGVTAMLVIPGATWLHYLCVLLPLAAYAWPTAALGTRAVLVAGGALVSAGVVWLPLAVIGATVMTAGTLRTTLRLAR